MKVKFDMANAEANFAAALTRLATLPGLDRRGIVRAEAGSVLKKCVSETKRPPSQATLTTAGRLRSIKALGMTGGGKGAALVTISAGAKGSAVFGRVWLKKKTDNGGSRYRRTHDGNFHPLNQHYTDADWAMIRAAISDVKNTIGRVVPEVTASAGLARQSWILIGDSMGLRLESVPGGGAISSGAIATARNAKARGNRQTRNGSSQIEERTGYYGVVLINRLPYGSKLGFQRMILAAIAGRASFIGTALSRGFAGSAADVAKLFPGWRVTGGAS